MQVCNHELLGHGTGRLLQESTDGKLNFDPATLINPLTGKPVTSWYKPGETYGSRVGPCSSSMEECRAESVALYLASNRDILNIFAYNSDEDAENLIYYTFLVMARAGVVSRPRICAECLADFDSLHSRSARSNGTTPRRRSTDR